MVSEGRQKGIGMEEQSHLRHPTIGWLTQKEVNTLSVAMWKGVYDVIKSRGANLLHIPGDVIALQMKGRPPANVLYDLIGSNNVDGLLIWGGLLSQETTSEEFLTFCERYQPMPLVNVGLPLRGIPSVWADNYTGMQDMIRHLVDEHGYRRIAFLRGGTHAEAERRYRAYADLLREYIILDQALVIPSQGQQRADGAEGVRILLEERQVDFDVVVASNDIMALGAMEALQARGLRIPQDVAVVGFDDLDEARAVSPPLTSVRQPVYEMTRQAAEMLVALLAGEETPEEIRLPVELMVRQSCGCVDRTVAKASVGLVQPSDETFEEACGNRKPQVAEAVRHSVSPFHRGIGTDRVLSPGWAEGLLDAFVADLKGIELGAFLKTLGDLIDRSAPHGWDVMGWHSPLSVLRRHALPCLVNEPALLTRAEDLWQQARVLIGEMAQREQAHRALETARQAEMLREIGQALTTTVDMDDLLQVVEQELPTLGISSCALSVYENPKSPLEWSNLILAYDQHGQISLTADERRFASRDLAPAKVLSAEWGCCISLEPLYFGDHQLGFALLKLSPQQAWARESLRRQLSSALENVLLLQRVESNALQLRTAAEVSRAASSILDPDELIWQVVDLVRERFDLYYAGLFLVEQATEEEEWAVLRAGTGEAGQQMVAQGHRLAVGGDSMIGQCVATGRARIALDVGEEAVHFENPLLPDTHSEMALPLVSRGRAIGALTIQSVEPAAFSEQDVVVLQTMTSQVANAIENARLFNQAQVALRDLEAAQRRYLEQSWGEYLRSVEVTGYETERPGVARLGEAVLPEVRQAMARQAPVVLSGDEPQTDERSGVVVPISLRGAVIGALGVHDDAGTRRWTDEEVALVEAVSDRLAQAAENLRLLDETQRRAARERLTREIIDKMRRAADMDTLMQIVIQETVAALGAPRAFVQVAPPPELPVGAEKTGDGSESS